MSLCCAVLALEVDDVGMMCTYLFQFQSLGVLKFPLVT